MLLYVPSRSICLKTESFVLVDLLQHIYEAVKLTTHDFSSCALLLCLPGIFMLLNREVRPRESVISSVIKAMEEF